MLFAIMSDSHDHWPNTKKAVQLANEKGCEVLLHAGDLIAPPGVAELKKFNGNVHFVFGNNEGERVGISNAMQGTINVKLEGNEMQREIAGLQVYMNHYPTIGNMAYKTGEYDLVVYGHDHTYHVEGNDKTMLINPGEICGYLTGDATFVIFDSETKKVEKIIL